MALLDIEIITQEKHLLSAEAESVTVSALEGEVTILPFHIPLFTKLNPGELVLKLHGSETRYVISGGFMDVSGGKSITILADSAIRSDEINLEKAQEARKNAEELMQNQDDKKAYLLAEAQLRRALMEIKIHNKLKHSKPIGQKD